MNEPHPTQEKATAHGIDGENNDFVREGQGQEYPHQGYQKKCQKNAPPPFKRFHLEDPFKSSEASASDQFETRY